MDDYKGIAYLRQKLKYKRRWVLQRYAYYDMTHKVRDFGISTPPRLMSHNPRLGWCRKAVDTLANRVTFREFRNDTFGFNSIFRANNKDIFVDSAIKGALISACDFAYISKGQEEEIRIQIIDGGNATGIIDPITNLLTEGLAVLKRDDKGNALIEAYFTKEKVEIIEGDKVVSKYNAPGNYATLVPIINDPDATRPFGQSRISRACMSIEEAAIRTIKRSEISAEFYSFPQKYVLGTSEDAEIPDKWAAAMSSMLEFTLDEDGNKPTVGQFSQQSMAPHVEQLKMFANLFSGETGLSLDDLGFPGSNPMSAESIKATHENLRLSARKLQRDIGSALVNIGMMAVCLKDEKAYNRESFEGIEPIFEPIFEPDSSMLSAIGDGVLKINQAIPDYINESNMRDLTGIKSEEV